MSEYLKIESMIDTFCGCNEKSKEALKRVLGKRISDMVIVEK